MKRKHTILIMILDVIAGILLLYAIWAVIHTAQYINNLVTQGQLTVKGHEFDIINFYMSSCAQYAVFAVILFTLGCILKKLAYERSAAHETPCHPVTQVEVISTEETKDDLTDTSPDPDKI